MNTSTKIVISAVLAVVIAGGVYGGYKFLFSHPQNQQLVGQSDSGSTFGNERIAAIVFNPATASATSTSILNTDANDRYVSSNFAGCSNATTSFTAVSGAGLANFMINAATTSTAAPAVVSNTNFVMNDVMATGTTAKGTAGFGNILISSSSIPTNGSNNNAGSASFLFVWQAGSYLTFFANATNTAQCTVGVRYIPS